ARGAGAARQPLLIGATAQTEPMPEPLYARGLVETQLLLEIFSHARDDEGMRVHRQHLRQRAHMRPRPHIRWQKRRLRIFFLEIVEGRPRLHERRGPPPGERRGPPPPPGGPASWRAIWAPVPRDASTLPGCAP